MEKKSELYRGKAKTIYATDDADLVIVEFRDDVTAFNKLKFDQISEKGQLNNQFNAAVMAMLTENNIPNHFQKLLSPTESLVRRLDMIPLECVIRNRAAGSLCKRYGIPEGEVCKQPIIEFYYKKDELGDPLVNDDHILVFEWTTAQYLEEMRTIARKINQILVPFFAAAELILVDYKLEFGCYNGQLLLGDEITPDGCRIWDKNTSEKLDKDRFRYDLGDLMTGYREVARRLQIPMQS